MRLVTTLHSATETLSPLYPLGECFANIDKGTAWKTHRATFLPQITFFQQHMEESWIVLHQTSLCNSKVN